MHFKSRLTDTRTDKKDTCNTFIYTHTQEIINYKRMLMRFTPHLHTLSSSSLSPTLLLFPPQLQRVAKYDKPSQLSQRSGQLQGKSLSGENLTWTCSESIHHHIKCCFILTSLWEQFISHSLSHTLTHNFILTG